MKILVTGASGFVGSAIAKELLDHGYEVVGLARSAASARKVEALGARVQAGDITDIPGLKTAVQKVDGVIHTAFNHDFSRFQESCNEERTALLAMGQVLKGSVRPLVVTAAAGAIATGARVTENDRGKNPDIPRVISEITVDQLAADGCHVSVVRLPPSVHGPGDTHGFVPTLVRLATARRKFACIGDGSNAWAAVNRLDVAPVYRLAMEKNTVAGARFHAVAESEIPFKQLTALLSEKTGLPLVSLSADQASEYFEGFFHFASLNIPISSDQTQQELGWTPTHPTLFEDIENGVYG